VIIARILIPDFTFCAQYMDVLRVIVNVLVLVVVILRVLFTLTKIQLKNYKLPFELIYFFFMLVSVFRITGYIVLYLAGDLSSGDFEVSFALEMGIYVLAMLSLGTYFVRRKEAELTENIHDKCEVCGGPLYTYGPADIIDDHHVCGACAKTIAENKTE